MITIVIMMKQNIGVGEPAHQLELVTKDAKSNPLFQWLVENIQTSSDFTSIFGISKSLKQSLKPAEEVEEKTYKLRQLSATH